jgi:hypothetical protein
MSQYGPLLHYNRSGDKQLAQLTYGISSMHADDQRSGQQAHGEAAAPALHGAS